MPVKAKPTAGQRLLTPKDHTLVLIDYQGQMSFATHSIDGIALRNNAGLTARAAASFKVPTVLTTIAEKTFSGPMFVEVTDPLPGQDLIDRTNLNAWEDERVIKAINGIGRNRVVLAGLWTSVCILGPALSAIDQGFSVYVIADACGDVSTEAHERAMERMVQAGAQPMTSLQYLLELQRDWARSATYESTTAIAKVHGSAYGLEVIYAKTIFDPYRG